MIRTIIILIVFLALTAPDRTTAESSCFPYDSAVVQADAHVRESHDFTSRAVRDVKAGDSFAVTRSKQDGDHCWIETRAGWLYIGYVKPDSTSTLTSQATATPINEPVWSAKGRGTSERSVSLELTRGVYKLNVLRPINEARVRSITLGSNISEPENCFVWYELSFPATIRIEQDCRLHSTLLVWIITRFEKTEQWEVSIIKESDDLPPLPQAQGWSARGRGGSGVPVEVVFDPGLYRVEKQSGPDMTMFPQYQSPTYCIGGYIGGVPTQFKITQQCRVKVYVNFLSDTATGAWSFSITKLNDGYVRAVQTVEPTATSTPTMQDAEDSCWLHDIVQVKWNTKFRVSYSLASASAGDATYNEIYDVIGSQQVDDHCWIETSAGWLYDGFVRPPSRPIATPVPLEDDDGCYPHDVAYVTRHTTIKASFGFTSKTVGSAKPGTIFDVVGSRKYGQHCWIETSMGWLFADYVVDAYDRCYPRDVATVSRQTAIRESYGFAYRSLVEARAGDTFAIMRSKLESGDCWLETSDGWLYGGVVEAVPTPDPTPEAQTTRDGCYPHALATVIRRWRLQASPSIDSDTLDHAEVGDTLEVMQSKEIGIYCWLDTSAGWLPQRAVSPTPPTPAPTGCYRWDIAYVTGQMNIRRSHSTASPVVAQANAGDILEVSGSVQGESYCWVEIEAGWMARTQLVRNSIPVPALPEITGDDVFRQDIISALHFLRDKLPHWYIYVTRVTGRIEPAPADADTSQAWATGRRITMHDDHLGSPLQAASILAHESCHFVQYNERRRPGRWDTEARVEHEKECLRIELRVIEEIEPRGSLAKSVRDTLNQPDWAFRLAMW